MEDVRAWDKKRRRLLLALAALLLLLAVAIVPPLVSINRYKSRITQLMSESLGRPVRLSSVELRILPMPGFVLTDLTVADDPSFGAEPVLHANTVTATIRLLSLWRGRLEISKISVDEASLNLVRTAEGRWNLDAMLRTAAKAQPGGDFAGEGRHQRAMPLPYLQATNSRINFKLGAEKLPFSLVETDLSFWQEQPGDWRIRLRGQPARTDLSLDLADTGLVRLEARMQSVPELRKTPLHLDLEWRDAQLGQLARLLIGSDPGWRGDLTGELHLDGTPDAAAIKTRLRATGVHRAEFAPAAPMDFDASCAFLYHLSARSVENLTCDSPLGDGRIHVAGELTGNGASPQVSIALDRIPVAAGLDALRTVRSDFGPGLEAAGTISGKINYTEVSADAAPEKQFPRRAGSKAKPRPVAQGPLTGSFTVDGFQLSGDGLSTPIQASKLVLEPVVSPSPSQAPARPAAINSRVALETTVTIPAGGASPLSVTARVALSGYRLAVHGQAGIARAKELARMAGMADAAALDTLAGDPVIVDMDAAGPWMPTESLPTADITRAAIEANASSVAMGTRLAADVPQPLPSDSVSGTVTLRNANWKADYLASHVLISQATLHLGNGEQRWDPVVFSYGPVNGTASFDLPAHCAALPRCQPTFEVHFVDLDAAALQAAILGAHEKGTLLSTLIARLRPSNSSNAPAWPALEGTAEAKSLILGPVTLTNATAALRIRDNHVEIADLEADLLDGHVHGSGSLTAASGESKPAYALEGHFEKLNPAAVGQLLGLSWTGRSFDADGKIDLSGFTREDLAASAKGTIHFDWRHGVLRAEEDKDTPSITGAVPAALAHFDRWTADAEIADGTFTLKQNEVQQGSRKRPVEGTLTLGDPPSLNFAEPKETQARR